MTKKEFENMRFSKGMKNKEQCYSVDNERYKSWEGMIDDLRESYNEGEEVEVWEADKVEWNHADFINVDDLIYRMQENAMDCCGESADCYLDDITEQQKLNLRDCISAWLSVNAKKINFYGVENEHKIIVVVE